MNFLNGPLGGHRNYLTHIALQNCFEFFSLQKHHKESNDSSTRAKYEELRRFLNAVESLNNVLEYAYYELERAGPCIKFEDFRKAAWGEHSELRGLADLANAYKHCVRDRGGKKRAASISARNLQKPEVHVMVRISQDKKVKVDADYRFEGPLPEHLEMFDRAFRFWFDYHNHPASTEFSDLARGRPA